MQTLRNRWLTLLMGTVLCSGLSKALAASTNYGNFIGSTVTYTGVTESSGTDPVPLYNAPIVSGNTLDFNPTFSAFAEGGSDTTDGQLSMGIVSMAGNAIEGLLFSEAGDYSMVGDGSAFVDVTATFYVDIYSVDFDGPGIDPILKLTNSMTFSPNASGTVSHTTPPFTDGQWSGGISIDIENALVNADVDFSLGATFVSVTLDNRLVAYSSATGTTSFIDKKDLSGFSITVVPEPSTAALGLLGLLGVFGALKLRVSKSAGNPRI